MSQDLSSNLNIQNLNQLMAKIETEINEVRSGKLPEGKARIMFRGRTLQLQGASLFLQAARLEARLRPSIMDDLQVTPKPKIARAYREATLRNPA
jgi:hypothetical protein